MQYQRGTEERFKRIEIIKLKKNKITKRQKI